MKTKHFFGTRRSGDVIALLAGALLTLAFAPFNFSPLGIICPALLLATWLEVSPWKAFWRGWLFGLGLFTTGIYWIYISIHNFGNASVFLSLFITVGLIALVALFPALSGYLLNKLYPRFTVAKTLLAFPAIWVFMEWARSWFLTGFPWLSLGYSQMNSSLRGYAPLFGIYGVSLVVLISSALILNTFLQAKPHDSKSIRTQYPYLFYLLILWGVGAGFTFISWTAPSGYPVQVSLVQGNIPQQLKWSHDEIQPTLDRYETLTKQHLDSKIIIWPEGAIPQLLQDAKPFVNKMITEAKLHKSAILTGIPVKAPDKEGYYNAIITLGDGHGIYYKHRLVPFGEYIPMPSLLQGILGSLDIPMSEFISGSQFTPPIEVGDIKISAFICYEIAFPEQVLDKQACAGIILTVSNDAWFGHSIAQAQHLQMAQMRALENGRPVLFVSNDGITAIIGPNGEIQSAAAPFQTTVLTDKVQPQKGKTPWQHDGMDPLFLVLIVFLIIAFRARKS